MEEQIVTQLPDIVYEPGAVKSPAWYDLGAPLGVALASIALIGLCAMMLLEKGPAPKILGAVALVAYSLYAGRYFKNVVYSRGLLTTRASLTEAALESTCRQGTKRFALDEIVYTMSYSSATNLCIVAATETDFMTIRCSCGYLFAKDGKQALTPFYALNKRLMELNPGHVNFVRNKRYRRAFAFKVPLFVFETEFDTARVVKLIDALRMQYRFR